MAKKRKPQEVPEAVQEEVAVEPAQEEVVPEVVTKAAPVPTPVGVAAKPVQANKLGREYEMVEINVSYPVSINGQKFYGMCNVPRHQAESIAELVQKKRRADLEIFTGNKYSQRFLPNGDRIITKNPAKDE